MPVSDQNDETGFTMRFAKVILPDLGAGLDATIVISHWFAARGERVWEGDRLVEVLVGPATFDVSSPATGRLAEIREREDDRVRAGSVLGLIALHDDDAGDAPDRESESRGDPPSIDRPAP